MPPIPEVIALLDRIRTIHTSKNEDYSSGGPFENFERAATIISWFKHNEDKAFVNHIATKLARLATLLSSDKPPNNESIEDSFVDLATYCVLWASFHCPEYKSGSNQAGMFQPHKRDCNIFQLGGRCTCGFVSI